MLYVVLLAWQIKAQIKAQLKTLGIEASHYFGIIKNDT